MDIIRWIIGIIIMILGAMGVLGTFINFRKRGSTKTFVVAIIVVIVGYAIVPH